MLKLDKEQFRKTLEDWVRSSGDVLLDMYFPHSASGGTLYLLKTIEHIQKAISQAEEAKYGDGTSILTAIRNKFYPLRGKVDEEFIKQIRAAWPGDRWYSIVDLNAVYPQELSFFGSGDSKELLNKELEELLSGQTGDYVGFGEHPMDTDDWCDRNDIEAIETTVGKLRFK